MIQPEFREKTSSVIVKAYPCSGVEKAGVPEGHLYNIEVDGESIGWSPLGVAKSRYPNITVVTSTHDLCDSCAKEIFGE